jgi:hypothetical protein
VEPLEDGQGTTFGFVVVFHLEKPDRSCPPVRRVSREETTHGIHDCSILKDGRNKDATVSVEIGESKSVTGYCRPLKARKA